MAGCPPLRGLACSAPAPDLHPADPSRAGPGAGAVQTAVDGGGRQGPVNSFQCFSEDGLPDHMLFHDVTVGNLRGPAGWSLRGRVQATILRFFGGHKGQDCELQEPQGGLNGDNVSGRAPCPGASQGYSGPVVSAPFLHQKAYC